jgi:transcription-repair coupling factor (superfamily II helicase)
VQARSLGCVREYLVIEYAPAQRGQPPDRLYVPMAWCGEVIRSVLAEVPAEREG